jgi:hypothetical protein
MLCLSHITLLTLLVSVDNDHSSKACCCRSFETHACPESVK